MEVVRIEYYKSSPLVGSNSYIVEDERISLLLKIVNDWEDSYIDNREMDSETFKVSIVYEDNSVKSIKGKGLKPSNMGEFERLVVNDRQEVI